MFSAFQLLAFAWSTQDQECVEGEVQSALLQFLGLFKQWPSGPKGPNRNPNPNPNPNPVLIQI